MKKVSITLIALLTTIIGIAQDSHKPTFTLGVSFIPTQYDLKSEYWSGAEDRSISESGKSRSFYAMVEPFENSYIKATYIKHRDTEEITRSDNQGALQQAGGLFVFLVSGSFPKNDVVIDRQVVKSASQSFIVSGLFEQEEKNGYSIGGEFGLGIRSYKRSIHAKSTKNGNTTSEDLRMESTRVPTVVALLRMKQHLFGGLNLVGNIGIASTPISCGIEYKF